MLSRIKKKGINYYYDHYFIPQQLRPKKELWRPVVWLWMTTMQTGAVKMTVSLCIYKDWHYLLMTNPFQIAKECKQSQSWTCTLMPTSLCLTPVFMLFRWRFIMAARNHINWPCYLTALNIIFFPTHSTFEDLLSCASNTVQRLNF